MNTLWENGWLLAARHVPSPNFGPRPADVSIDLLVIHSISLPPGEYGGPHIDALFTNRLDPRVHPYFQTIAGLEVSSHFLINRSGEVTQYVSILDRAWHAGRSHWQGRDNCNDFSVGIELEGLEGGPFEPAQYDALTQLAQALKTTLTPPCDTPPSASWRLKVAGHEHIAPGRKHDPGPGFDWVLCQQKLGWSPQDFP